MRKLLFALYGLGIGLVYALLLLNAGKYAWTASIGLFLFPFVGWILGETRMSSGRVLLWLPLAPLHMAIWLVGLIFVPPMIWLWPAGAGVLVKQERQLRRRMQSNGRIAVVDDLQLRWGAGEGAFIVEFDVYRFSHVWWTKDDLVPFGTPQLSSKERAELCGGKTHPFNSRCVNEYLHEDTGRALLTSIPPRWVRSGRLAQIFPRMRIVEVVYSRIWAYGNRHEPHP